MQANYEMKLPWVPSVNTYYRRAGNHIHLSNKGRSFKAEVVKQLKAMRLQNEAIKDRLKVHIELIPPNRRKFDIDNRIKPLLDALQDAGLFADDEQIDILKVNRMAIDGNKEGYCLVRIETLK